jgi:FKBP-type peptidyl-prolyl cis-trans isomerase
MRDGRSGSLLLAVLAIFSASCVARTRTVTRPSGLAYQVLAKGRGPMAVRGQKVTIHETTTLPNGTLIYTSRGGGPITFQLGASQVITGVDEGVTGMRVGERRRLVVPPVLSQRTSYPANTPRDSTLHIDVELMQIRP